MENREKLLQTVKNILIGPNPLPGYTQNDGEEILFFDSPLKTYIAGVLFPQTKIADEIQEDHFVPVENDIVSETDYIQEESDKGKRFTSEKNIAEPAIEAETSRINTYQQSAMGITFCVPEKSQKITINASVGAYTEQEKIKPREKKNEEGTRTVVMSEKQGKCYFRKQINASIAISKNELPIALERHKQYNLFTGNDEKVNGLEVAVTYRLSRTEYTIFTVTLLNTKNSGGIQPHVRDCWFQTEFKVTCDIPVESLPDNFWAENDDEDYLLNALLYRDIKTYAIGHGCAATWDDKTVPTTIVASTLPEYEVKPIVPGCSTAKLSMKLYSEDIAKTIEDLKLLCTEYKDWIEKETVKITLIEPKHHAVAQKQIELCRKCFMRMESGIKLLQSDKTVLNAFMLANQAMLMQQLHYKLPLIGYADYDKENFKFILERKITMPDIDNETTWHGDKNAYGKWRPFQIAFILLNLCSIADKKSSERGIVDLIWFPTGGGKTEAYLGLTAFTIFLRRLKNPEDAGTTVIMRYTLRLLTAQQYERASSLICAMEKIRSEKEKFLGRERITIGLWVGASLTANKTKEVIDRRNAILRGKETGNVSIMLKCPWCGASMETYRTGFGAQTPGYELTPDKKHIIFKCANEGCDFWHDNFSLPLQLFDNEIYDNPPTLLFGTVDKFAMLPYRPEAKSLFGGDGQNTSPELIIQDELHLITGPLGSAVGLYETLIAELCKQNGHAPKIIASTATISHAKQQCNALYGCGEEMVFQFPAQGTSYNDCFFAREDKNTVGRKYIGLYGTAASSSATASIYAFAAFLYAAKALPVKDESERDPYWTNLAYFGSMRELGQAATWFIADIKERLEVLYQNRLETMAKNDRRYIYESGLAELTSRMDSDDIPKILKKLEIRHGGQNPKALDVCLATNMISVGVDISRLGLMTITGQPKSASEYIQATSRVGRTKEAPGLVFVIYNTSKPRDKSHYEKFQAQHSKLYFHVEPTSVTPFARPLRERALHAVFVALHRFSVDYSSRENARRVPNDIEFEKLLDIIVTRAQGIDSDEIDDIKNQANKLWKEWKAWKPEKYQPHPLFEIEEVAPLMCPAGMIKPVAWEDRGWHTPMSMRNVDRECGLTCAKALISEIKDDNG
jgi:hypothetical protein